MCENAMRGRAHSALALRRLPTRDVSAAQLRHLLLRFVDDRQPHRDEYGRIATADGDAVGIALSAGTMRARVFSARVFTDREAAALERLGWTPPNPCDCGLACEWFSRRWDWETASTVVVADVTRTLAAVFMQTEGDVLTLHRGVFDRRVPR